MVKGLNQDQFADCPAPACEALEGVALVAVVEVLVPGEVGIELSARPIPAVAEGLRRTLLEGGNRRVVGA